MSVSRNKFLSLFLIILGTILIGWGISYFIKQLALIVVGIILLVYGIKLRIKTPIKTMAIRWITHRMGFFR